MKFKFFRLLKTIFSGQLKFHTAQYGEDIYLHKIFRNSQNRGFYLDVGAHHPFAISNTAYLWLLGWSGINVDASESAIRLFNSVRKNDINISGAVISEKSLRKNPKTRFYFNSDIDNCATCDAELARQRNLVNWIDVRSIGIIELIKMGQENFGDKFDLLNIDIEGLDEEVIENIKLWPIYPRFIMIEIYSESIDELYQKKSVINLKANGYSLKQRMGHTAVFEKSK